MRRVQQRRQHAPADRRHRPPPRRRRRRLHHERPRGETARLDAEAVPGGGHPLGPGLDPGTRRDAEGLSRFPPGGPRAGAPWRGRLLPRPVAPGAPAQGAGSRHGPMRRRGADSRHESRPCHGSGPSAGPRPAVPPWAHPLNRTGSGPGPRPSR
ncbi:hypothetical protein SGPA1_30033 [Streptomyces misionensis JCM 4497]